MRSMGTSSVISTDTKVASVGIYAHFNTTRLTSINYSAVEMKNWLLIITQMNRR